MKNYGNKYNKPKNITSDDLYRIEVWLNKERQYRIIRDCNYNEKDKIFTQIDDFSTFHLYEIHEWKRQT